MLLQSFAGDCRVLPDTSSLVPADRYCSHPMRISSAVSKRQRCSDYVFADAITIPELRLAHAASAKLVARPGNCILIVLLVDKGFLATERSLPRKPVGSVAVVAVR